MTSSLQPGSEVYLLSTARALTPEQQSLFVRRMAELGYVPIVGNTLSQKHGVLAGTDEQRLADLQQALDHPTARAIWCGRGGYGTSRLLDSLDWTAYRKKPKWIIGFSDVTALLAAAVQNGGLAIHGPMGFSAGQPGTDAAWSHTHALLCGQPYGHAWQTSTQCINGETMGRLIGGNLCMLAHLAGTPTNYDYEGAILFVEDIDEYLYQVDRMLVQLQRCGLLSRLAGVVVGAFSDIKDNEDPFGYTLEEILDRAFRPLGIPVAYGYSAGHIAQNLPLPIGRPVRLASQDGYWQMHQQ